MRPFAGSVAVLMLILRVQPAHAGRDDKPESARRTVVSIRGENFLINGKLTYNDVPGCPVDYNNSAADDNVKRIGVMDRGTCSNLMSSMSRVCILAAAQDEPAGRLD